MARAQRLWRRRRETPARNERVRREIFRGRRALRATGAIPVADSRAAEGARKSRPSQRKDETHFLRQEVAEAEAEAGAEKLPYRQIIARNSSLAQVRCLSSVLHLRFSRESLRTQICAPNFLATNNNGRRRAGYRCEASLRALAKGKPSSERASAFGPTFEKAALELAGCLSGDSAHCAGRAKGSSWPARPGARRETGARQAKGVTAKTRANSVAANKTKPSPVFSPSSSSSNSVRVVESARRVEAERKGI